MTLFHIGLDTFYSGLGWTSAAVPQPLLLQGYSSRARIQKLLGMGTERQKCDLISLLLLFENKESRLKIFNIIFFVLTYKGRQK
jgi:hypothetical protein